MKYLYKSGLNQNPVLIATGFFGLFSTDHLNIESEQWPDPSTLLHTKSIKIWDIMAMLGVRKITHSKI